MNRFSIDENDQFEIPRVFQANEVGLKYGYIYFWKVCHILSGEAEENSMNFRNRLHFIITKPNVSFDYSFSIHSFETFAVEFGIESAIFTLLASKKARCCTQEVFEVLYKTDEDVDEREDLSIGEDLESLLERIKSGEIWKDLGPVNHEYKRSFNLQLLTSDEMAKLRQKDESFMQTFSDNDPDIPKETMDKSDSKKNSRIRPAGGRHAS